MGKDEIKTLLNLCGLAEGLGDQLAKPNLRLFSKKAQERFSKANAYRYARTLLFLHRIFAEILKKDMVAMNPLDTERLEGIINKTAATPFFYEDFKKLIPCLVGALNWAYLSRQTSPYGSLKANPHEAARQFEKRVYELVMRLQEIKNQEVLFDE